MELRRVLDAVEHLGVVEVVEAGHLQRARLERADTAGDDDRLAQQAGAPGGLDKELAVVALLHDGDFLAEVEGWVERLDLLEQRVGQFLAGAHRHRRDVVDRLVRVELDALAARRGQRVDDVRLDLQQAQFEDLEQADRAGADDDGVGLDRAGRVHRNQRLVLCV